MRNLPSVAYFDLSGGRDDQSDAIELPNTKMQEIVNFHLERDSLIKRGGYKQRHASAITGTPNIQRIHQHIDNVGTRNIIIAADGELYRHADTPPDTPVNITGTAGDTPGILKTERDAVFHFVNYDGKCIGTDGENGLFVIPDVSSDAEPVGTTKGIPTKAGVVGTYYEHILLGDITEPNEAGISTRYPYRMAWNIPPDIDNFSELDRHNDFDRNQRLIAFAQHGEYLLIFMERSIWIGTFAAQGGLVQTEFNFRKLDDRVGCVSAQTVVTTDRGTFWLDNKGPYWLPPGPPSYPRYIGKPMETFWKSVQKPRLPYAVGAEIPEKNSVLWTVAFGDDQIINNRGILINYEEWSRIGREVHPAFCLWTGTTAQNFNFNALARIVEGTNERERIVGGTYNGWVCTLDEGTSDFQLSSGTTGAGIESGFKTPMYWAGDRTRDKIWYNFGFDVDLQTQKTVSVLVRLFNDPIPKTTSYTVGTQSPGIGSFVIGTSRLASHDLGRIKGTLHGRSRYIEMEVTVGTEMTAFELHGIYMYFKHGGRWS